MKLAMVCLGRRCSASWRRALSSSPCSRANFCISGCIVVSGWSSSTMPRAPMTSPGSVAQRQPADEEGAGVVGQQVHQDGLPGVDDVRHQRVGHHLFDALADEVALAGKAQRRQEVLVAVADPDDAVLAVDHHRAHGRARKACRTGCAPPA
jgi:hypothetical protein